MAAKMDTLISVFKLRKAIRDMDEHYIPHYILNDIKTEVGDFNINLALGRFAIKYINK